jgi:hypothetical protein
MITTAAARYQHLERAHNHLHAALAELVQVASVDVLTQDIPDLVRSLREMLGLNEEGTGFDVLIRGEKEALASGRAQQMFEIAARRRQTRNIWSTRRR